MTRARRLLFGKGVAPHKKPRYRLYSFYDLLEEMFLLRPMPLGKPQKPECVFYIPIVDAELRHKSGLSDHCVRIYTPSSSFSCESEEGKKRLPSVVWLHGWYSDISRHDHHLQNLADRMGTEVICPEYLGYGPSFIESEKLGMRPKFNLCIDGTIDLLLSLLQENQEWIMMGRSLGSFFAQEVVFRMFVNPPQPNDDDGELTVLSSFDHRAQGILPPKGMVLVSPLHSMGGLVQRHLRSFRMASSIDWLMNGLQMGPHMTGIPLLMFHGEADPLITKDMALEFFHHWSEKNRSRLVFLANTAHGKLPFQEHIFPMAVDWISLLMREKEKENELS